MEYKREQEAEPVINGSAMTETTPDMGNKGGKVSFDIQHQLQEIDWWYSFILLLILFYENTYQTIMT